MSILTGSCLPLTMHKVMLPLLCGGFALMTSSPAVATGATESIIQSTESSVIVTSNRFQLNDREKKWLAKHPKIRIGTMNAWPPMDYVNKDGLPQGIGSRVIAALNLRLNNAIENVPGPWTDIFSDTKARRLDALMGITPQPDREAFLNFTTPYVTVPHAIFARKDSPSNFDTLADLSGKTVAIERGFFIANVLRDSYPNIEVKEYNSSSDAIDALTKGIVDAYIGNRAVAMYVIEMELISNIKQHGKISNTSSINAIGVRKDWPILRDILQKALDDISHNELRKILSKWSSSAANLSSAVNLSAGEKKWIKEHPVMRIAFDESYPPYSFRNKQGKIVGIAVDYAQELANRVGLTIDVYPEGEWKKLYSAAQRREVDVIATLVKLEGRKHWFEFTRPYISLAQYVVTKKEDTQTISQAAFLAGKTVALVEDYSMTRVILDEIDNIKPYYVNNLSEALEAVSVGKADATIGAIGMSHFLISSAGLSNLGFAALYSKGQSEQRFGVRNDWPELASILDKSLQSLSDEEIINIFARWTLPDVASAEAELFETVVQLTDEERSWLSQHPLIRTASDPNWAPIEFIDEAGNYRGISIDYLQQIEKILGIKFQQVKDQSWTQMVENFNKGDIDLFSSLNKTPERRAGFNFTDSYTHFPIAIFSDADIAYIGDLHELDGSRVGVVKGYLTEQLIIKNHPEIELVTTANPIEALKQLSRGDIDAYIGNVLVTSYYIGQLGYTHIRIVGESPYKYQQSMGVRKDWPIFVSILNKALNAIPETEKNAIYHRWIGIHYKYGFDYALLWKVLAVVFVLFAIYTYWNRKLTALNKQLVIARGQEEKSRITVEHANKQLKAMDKLKSMFIATMSHELRTPLNSIIGFSGLLLQGISGDLNEKQKDSLQRISRSGNHLLNLISDVIDISKIEAGRLDAYPERFSLKDVIDEAVESIRPLADDKAIKLIINVDTWPTVTTDRKRLLQCLLNYMSNAIKYSEKGTVTVSITEKRETIEISIADTGIGISEQDMPRLFDAFERMDSHLRIKAGGTGLGLYLTKKITEELLHGKVSVNSQINEGSTFRLEFPITT